MSRHVHVHEKGRSKFEYNAIAAWSPVTHAAENHLTLAIPEGGDLSPPVFKTVPKDGKFTAEELDLLALAGNHLLHVAWCLPLMHFGPIPSAIWVTCAGLCDTGVLFWRENALVWTGRAGFFLSWRGAHPPGPKLLPPPPMTGGSVFLRAPRSSKHVLGPHYPAP